MIRVIHSSPADDFTSKRVTQQTQTSGFKRIRIWHQTRTACTRSSRIRAETSSLPLVGGSENHQLIQLSPHYGGARGGKSGYPFG